MQLVLIVAQLLCCVFVNNLISVSAMWSYLHPKNQKQLIHALQASGALHDERVAEVMMAVDRAHYCTEHPYVDGAMSIGYGATISAPHMHAYGLEKLGDHLVEGARALDVGSGSGYMTACMALMVGRSGLVVGVEHMPELLNKSIANILLDQPDLYRSGNIKLVEGDGRVGHPEDGPYDAIHVGAAAKEIPQPLLDQLKPGGRMVIPVGDEDSAQVMYIIDKYKNGRLVKRADTSVRFIPLTDKSKQCDY